MFIYVYHIHTFNKSACLAYFGGPLVASQRTAGVFP